MNYAQGSTTLLNTAYTYDNNGNIAATTVDGVTYTYTYDSLNQLKTVSTSNNSYTASYSYDNGGNITSKTVNGTTISYGYGDTNWKDKLTSYDGQSITYDAIGNPLAYRDGLTFTWTGRRMDTASLGGVTSNYLYNADGIRTRKTVGSAVTDYFINGGTILAEQTGSTVIWYIYDSDGEILGFTYNGTPYYYIKNVQGDVYKVVNAGGSVVASYTYDAWGKVLSATGSMANVNPIRYRSYYYDKETNLYYLQSRYYDPETGRFINADGQLNVGFGLIGCNLFAYCYNNTVAGVDYDGNRPKFERSFGGRVSYTDAATSGYTYDKRYKRMPNGGSTSFTFQSSPADSRTKVSVKATYYSPAQVSQIVRSESLELYTSYDPLQIVAANITSKVVDAGMAKLGATAPQLLSVSVLADIISLYKEDARVTRAKKIVDINNSGKGMVIVEFDTYGARGQIYLAWDGGQFGSYPYGVVGW